MRILTIAVLFVGALAVIGYIGLRMAATSSRPDDRVRGIANRLGIEPIEASDVTESPAPAAAAEALVPSRPGTVVIDGIPPGFENIDLPDDPQHPGLTAAEAAAVQQALRTDPQLRAREGYGSRLDADRAFIERRPSKDEDPVVGGRRRGSCGLKRKLQGQLRKAAARRMAPANR